MPNYYPQQQQLSRLNYLEQQQAPLLKGRPVSSIEEVRAMSVDFDGSISYFPDLANNKIFSKQIGLNGQSVIRMYELAEIPQPATANVTYVTQQEFNCALEKLTAQLENIKQGGAIENDKSKQPNGYSF